MLKNCQGRSSSGYTLIELIITSAIIIILVSLGIASYNNFNQTQNIKQTALALKNNLRLAQSKALSGEKICGYATEDSCGGENDQVCDGDDGDDGEIPLNYWTVTFNGDSYDIYGECGNIDFSLKTYVLPEGISFISPGFGRYISFNYQPSGVVKPKIICLGDLNNKRYKISVTASGEIVDYGFVSSCN